VWRGKESLHVIRSIDGRLLLHRMYYQDEIRPFEELPKNGQKPAAAELKLATQLIESISSDTFDAAAYRDEYRERVLELIQEKSKGKTISLAPKTAVRPTEVVDLMQRLKESVAQNAQKKSARSRALPAQTARDSAKKASSGRR
jgi:DNA end-binding protein Ku